jgi:hypothetical protein
MVLPQKLGCMFISKYRLSLQAKVDIAKDMDMCMKVKELGANM